MYNYQFKNTFIKYSAILVAFMLLLISSIAFIFNYQVNKEMKETASKESSYIINNINQPVADSYLYITNSKNNTPFSASEFSSVKQKHNDNFMWKNSKGYYYVTKSQLGNGEVIYTFRDFSDYEETKHLLFQLLIILFFVSIIITLATSYYLAIKPIKTYEKMLNTHKEFIQNATHEMKTPLASISLGMTYIEVIDGKKLSDESKNSITKVQNEVQYLQSIINKSLDIEVAPEQEEINVAETLNNIISQLEWTYSIHVVKSYDTNLIYRINRNLLKQILIILIDNAVKHNDNYVTIKVMCKIEKGRLKIAVEDDGKGIPPESIPLIFDRKFTLDNEHGTGIGLDILKTLVLARSGEIKVESDNHVRTIFTIIL